MYQHLSKVSKEGSSKFWESYDVDKRTLRVLGGYIKLLLRIPIFDLRHRRILESGEETLELQGGKKFKSLVSSLGIVIYVSQHSVLGK